MQDNDVDGSVSPKDLLQAIMCVKESLGSNTQHFAGV